MSSPALVRPRGRASVDAAPPPTVSGDLPSALTDPIEEFYTRHPYPRPVENLDRAFDEWRDVNRDRAEFHLMWPGKSYRADLDVLVAGCGTWQAAKYALCRSPSRVVGIDVSLTSVECTAKLKRQYDLANLELRQLPIERAEALDRSFDLIVCTGVLHHLADPEAGLRALRSILKPDGAMYVMVYAPYGRAGASLLREYCRRLEIGSSDDEIDELVATLDALPRNHPLVPLLGTSRDAWSSDALADALLNPRERSYSVVQLLDWLEHNGLTFGRWYWQAPYLPSCGAISQTPHAARLSALPEREQYDAMELWRGTMATHSAVVYRRDTSVGDVRPHFDDARWLDYAPVRRPWTHLIEEHLPPDAAGALLNRSHTCHDLYIVLDARERRLFDGMNGRRSIAEIIELAHEEELERANRFFEKLWRYDQVVFDTSRAATPVG